MPPIVQILISVVLAAAHNPVVRALALAELKKLEDATTNPYLKLIIETAEVQIAAAA